VAISGTCILPCVVSTGRRVHQYFQENAVAPRQNFQAVDIPKCDFL